VDKAEAYFKKCLEYDPNFDYAVKNIEKINEIREGKIKI
jgi:Tfp pilus assembly protein PilF